MPVPPTDVLVVLTCAVFLGAFVQGSVGLGLGLIAAPAAAFVDPSLLPGMMLWLSAALPVFGVWREWRHVDWRGLSWTLTGRFAAVLPGALIVAAVSGRLLGLMVGVLVLVSVALTATVVTVPKLRSTLLGAGVISGITGTATSIGGPPVALIYQRESGPVVRATLAAYFVAGTVMSMIALAVTDQLTMKQLSTAVWLIPALAAGFGLAVLTRDRLDGQWIRVWVLVVCASSAVALIVRSL